MKNFEISVLTANSRYLRTTALKHAELMALELTTAFFIHAKEAKSLPKVSRKVSLHGERYASLCALASSLRIVSLLFWLHSCQISFARELTDLAFFLSGIFFFRIVLIFWKILIDLCVLRFSMGKPFDFA